VHVRNGNPAKQGLKHMAAKLSLPKLQLVRNGNPAKQGLKLKEVSVDAPVSVRESETEIQQNKD